MLDEMQCFKSDPTRVVCHAQNEAVGASDAMSHAAFSLSLEASKTVGGCPSVRWPLEARSLARVSGTQADEPKTTLSWDGFFPFLQVVGRNNEGP